MNTWKVILATMVIFGAGVITGGLLVHHALWRAPRAAHPAVPKPALITPPTPGVLRLEFLRRAQRDLDLSPAQRERIDKLIKESQEATRKLIEPIQPELQVQMKKTKEAFLEELTPQQRARFDELVKQQQQQQQRSRDHRTNAPAARN